MRLSLSGSKDGRGSGGEEVEEERWPLPPPPPQIVDVPIRCIAFPARDVNDGLVVVVAANCETGAKACGGGGGGGELEDDDAAEGGLPKEFFRS
jgi:hypothetical protein